MAFQVYWRPSAEEQLAKLWIEAADRNAVASAADNMESLLEKDPLKQGESRWGRTRILIIPPLAIYYDVFPSQNMVFVWAVWNWPDQGIT